MLFASNSAVAIYSRCPLIATAAAVRGNGYNCAVDPLTPVRTLDRLQRRRAVLGFPLGVVRKCADDHAGNSGVRSAPLGSSKASERCATLRRSLR
jgi:hypothetical protein